MGCGCGGSQQARTTPPREQGANKQQQAQQVGAALEAGGPGQPGYTWNGPSRPPVAPAAK